MDEPISFSPPLHELARSTPSDEESARRAVSGTAGLAPAERWRLFAELLREMDVLLGGRLPMIGSEDAEFWLHWKDPRHGRPR